MRRRVETSLSRGDALSKRTAGWRVSELLTLKVGQVDLAQRVIRLDLRTTKNSDGREVFMTDALHRLLSGCVTGKGAEEAVFSRPNGIAVRTFRDAWEKACINAGGGKSLCLGCATSVTSAAPCGKCGSTRAKYSGLIFNVLRRTAARNLRRAGIAETVIMKIGGWRPRSVFERYAIVSPGDIVEAMQKLETNQRESLASHEIGHAGDPALIDSSPTTIN